MRGRGSGKDREFYLRKPKCNNLKCHCLMKRLFMGTKKTKKNSSDEKKVQIKAEFLFSFHLGYNSSHMQNFAADECILPHQHCSYVTKNQPTRCFESGLLRITTEALTYLVIQ